MKRRDINVLNKVEGCFLWERQWSDSMACSPMTIKIVGGSDLLWSFLEFGEQILDSQ